MSFLKIALSEKSKEIMSREEYDMWRVEELNRLNPQLNGSLRAEFVEGDSYASMSTDFDGPVGASGSHYGAVVKRATNAKSGTFTHELLHMIDTLTNYTVRNYVEDALPPKAKSKVESEIYALAEELGILRKPMTTPDIEFEFQISKHNGLKKSIHNQLDYGGSYGDFARARINLDKIISNAVLVDAYTGRPIHRPVARNENSPSI